MLIKVDLKKNFQTQLNKLIEKYGDEFLYLNGIGESQLNFTDFIDNFIDTSVVADISIDANSNVSNKSVVGLLKEMSKPHQALLAYNKLYYEMQKKYGFKEANEWMEANFSRALYMHDFDTSTYKPYCFSYDLKDLAERGLFFINGLNAKPAKHLTTFISHLREYIMFNSNLTSGAVGLANLIPYMYYFWNRDCINGYAAKDPDYYARNSIQTFVYLVNQSAVRDGSQSAFTNVSIFDREYLTALFGGAVFPDGKYMIDELEGIMEFQRIFLDEVAKIREQNMFTFPVLSLSLLTKKDLKLEDYNYFSFEGKTEEEIMAEISSVFVDAETARWGLTHNMKWNDSNLFMDSTVNSLSNCCRLKASVNDMKQKWDGGYFNSIGGTALKVGSVKVSTINLARIALETSSPTEFLEKLKQRCELNCKILDVQRHIIKRNAEKGLLPNFTHKLIDFEHLYSTTGIIGIYETMKTFGYTQEDEFGNISYTKEGDQFAKQIFETIHNVITKFVEDKDYIINIEQIPGESAAAKLQRADSLLYPSRVVQDLPLYGNQYIPLGVSTTMQERIRTASLYDSYCNGGSILHANIDKPFYNFEQMWNVVKYIAMSNLTYFAFNTKIQSCDNNHAFYGKVCPVCGKKATSEWTRIVGFYTKTTTWSKERREEFRMREWHESSNITIEK